MASIAFLKFARSERVFRDVPKLRNNLRAEGTD